MIRGKKLHVDSQSRKGNGGAQLRIQGFDRQVISDLNTVIYDCQEDEVGISFFDLVGEKYDRGLELVLVLVGSFDVSKNVLGWWCTLAPSSWCSVVRRWSEKGKMTYY